MQAQILVHGKQYPASNYLELLMYVVMNDTRDNVLGIILTLFINEVRWTWSTWKPRHCLKSLQSICRIFKTLSGYRVSVKIFLVYPPYPPAFGSRRLSVTWSKSLSLEYRHFPPTASYVERILHVGKKIWFFCHENIKFTSSSQLVMFIYFLATNCRSGSKAQTSNKPVRELLKNGCWYLLNQSLLWSW